jgi:type III pantothenate kinase
MKANIVVDVGNNRVKWGLCRRDAVTQQASLPPNDPGAWERQLALWQMAGRLGWAVSGVHPSHRDALAAWARQRGDPVWLLESASQLPLRVALPCPDKVGIDRLLNAVAAKGRVQRSVPLLLIDAGTAVTVDWIDDSGRFQGGAILPGFRLMAQALHDHTALLPPVEVTSNPTVPGTTTELAIQAGVFWAVAGGIKALGRLLGAGEITKRRREVFLTGGDALLLAPVMDPEVTVWPTMTLEGIRLSAEAQR